MNTPIYDFVKQYAELRPARFHMPGHKGRGPLGCESLDITEIPGADSLFEAEGIIAESEAAASALFGCPTFYSTEGSSHCIRAMLLLACRLCRGGEGGGSEPPAAGTGRFRILAARNCHKSFLSAAALLDLDVCWLPPDGDSYLSANPTPDQLDRALAESGAAAVYLSCPDYLGKLPALRPLAECCHGRGALLLVDNAHGAYLHFLRPSRHPMELGADLCCDSAHKTLPVLTGGAYLHLAEELLSEETGCRAGMPRLCRRDVKEALALFGSSSPSYLTLQSLDLANPELEQLPRRLAAFLPRVETMKARLRAAGWQLIEDEPMKLTLDLRQAPRKKDAGTSAACLPPSCFFSGEALAAALERVGIYCEFFDRDFLVMMLSPENSEAELARLEAALKDLAGRSLASRAAEPCDGSASAANSGAEADVVIGHDRTKRREIRGSLPERVCSLREALLSPAEQVPAGESLGRVLARPGVSCPPAVPILMPGERIDAAALAAFSRYGIQTVSVLRP